MWPSHVRIDEVRREKYSVKQKVKQTSVRLLLQSDSEDYLNGNEMRVRLNVKV